MQPIHFESGKHKGAMRPVTAFERSLHSSIVYQHGKAIAEAKGFDWKGEDLPPILNVLLLKYFNWMPYTTFESGGLECVNFLTANGNLVTHFDSFVDLIANDVDLANAWQAAYEAVNKVVTNDDDEKKEANAPGNSETT